VPDPTSADHVVESYKELIRKQDQQIQSLKQSLADATVCPRPDAVY